MELHIYFIAMKVFRSVKDLGNLELALKEAMEIKADRYKYQELGKNKTALLIFFNNLKHKNLVWVKKQFSEGP